MEAYDINQDKVLKQKLLSKELRRTGNIRDNYVGKFSKRCILTLCHENE